MATLIHGKDTPTGFGIRQKKSGGLRACSGCCKRSFDAAPGDKIKCRGCKKTYTPIPKYNMTGEINIRNAQWATNESNSFSAVSWARAVTGLPELQMTVTL